MPVVWTDGRSLARSVYGDVITKFSYPWCSAARFARESSAIMVGVLHTDLAEAISRHWGTGLRVVVRQAVFN